MARTAAERMALLSANGAGVHRPAQRLAAGRLFYRAWRSRASPQIPAAVLEAATVDGANPVQRFAYITLPLLGNTLLFSAVIAIINAVQVFEPVALITQGGPVDSTNVLTYHIRRVGIERAQGGLGSSMAVTLMLALVVSIAALFAFARAREAGE